MLAALGFAEQVLHAISNPLLPASGAVALARSRTARSVRLLVSLCATLAFAIEVSIIESWSKAPAIFCAWAVAAAFWAEFSLHVARPVLILCCAAIQRVARALGRRGSGN